MIGRSPRILSQRNYLLLQEIRNEAERLKQIDKGLKYRSHNMAQTVHGALVPLHIGPEIELKADRAA